MAMTDKQFTQKLAGIKRSGNTLRDNIQSLLCDGGDHFITHGDTGRLTRLRDVVVGFKYLSTNKFDGYAATCFNVSVRKTKTGQEVFGKKGSGDPELLVDPEYLLNNMWWDFESDTTPKLQDIIKQLDALERNIVKGLPDAEHNHVAKPYVAEQQCALIRMLNGVTGLREQAARIMADHKLEIEADLPRDSEEVTEEAA